MIHRARATVVLAVSIVCAACTSTPGPDPTTTGRSTASQPSTGAALPSAAETTATLTPVTDPGLITGPGVDDAALSLGLLVDPERDHGFTAGVTLWADGFTRAGGVCGRAIKLVTPDQGASDTDAYESLSRNTFGLITLPSSSFEADLAGRVAADRIPAVTPEGTLGGLRTVGGPVVLGATADILALNTAAHWLTTGTLKAGGAVGVYFDISSGDTDAVDAVAALSWWAPRVGVQLVQLQPGEAIPAAVTAIYAPGSASGVRVLVDAVANGRGLAAAEPGSGVQASVPSVAISSTAPDPDAIAVATDLDSADELLNSPEADGKVVVASVTPAYTSAHPVGTALAQAFRTAGLTPGSRSFEGYAVGEAWGRILTPLCTARTLTRTAATGQWTSIGPAAADSIIGPTQPADQLSATLPNSRVSALSVIDPSVTTGLRPLTPLESAADIAQYRATG